MSMTAASLAEALSAEGFTLPCGSREIDGAYTGDLLSWVMGHAREGNAWVTIMTNNNVIAVASLLDLSCVIITENALIEPEIIRLAEEKGVNLLRTEADSFSVCRALSELL